MEKQVERQMDVLSGQRENRIVKDSYNTIVRCTNCQLRRRDSDKRGEKTFLLGYRRGQKGGSFHRNFLA